MPSVVDRAELRRRHERHLQRMAPASLDRLQALSLFGGIPEKARSKVIEKVRKYLQLVDFSDGETILREGDYSDSAFFVVSGSVEVALGAATITSRRLVQVRGGAHVLAKPRPGARPGGGVTIGRGARSSDSVILTAFPAEVAPGEHVALGEGEIFGEMSALSRYPVSATVQAASAVTLLRIRLPALRMLTVSSKEFKSFLDVRYRERTLARHLRNVPLFRELEDSFIDGLKERAELLSFEPGQLIVQEGTAADSFYLVRGGFVRVSVRAGTADLALTYLRKGDYAGETALILDEAWPFSLHALEHVELVRLGAEDFRAIVSHSHSVEEAVWQRTVSQLQLRATVSENPISAEYMQMAMETGLIHGESVLLIDLSTCTRCDDCVRACADTHQGIPRFIREGQKYRNWLIPTACYQCTDPVCMIDCPTGAITRDIGTLEVAINRETCIGCGNCAERCPWGNIIMVETGEKRSDGKPVELATKCDLCLNRAQGPACVQICPHKAAVRISFKDLDRVTTLLK